MRQKQVTFIIEKDPNQIKKVVEVCDNSFLIGITHRSNYLDILSKMQNYAEIIVPYDEFGREMGYASMYANDFTTRTAYISMFCIQREFQHLHFGHALMEECKKVAIEKGMEHIRLEVLCQNKVAYNFYLKCGFSYISRQVGDTMFMECLLT